jgi:translation initiation factor 4A
MSVEEVKSFDDMDLPMDILRGIYSFGFENPSLVQQQAIVPMIEGKDVIAQAQSGTGKTGAFTIGALSRIDIDMLVPQVLIVAPTRELAEQIDLTVQGIGCVFGVMSRVCVGGRRASEDAKVLNDGVHVVVGTPGRIIDLLKRGKLITTCIKVFVMDEADEMLSLGFQEDIKTIFKYLPPSVQVGVFSATLPTEALDITKNFLNDPVKILVNQEELTLDGIAQFYVDCQQEQYKYDVLKELYEELNIAKAIIFCNTRKRVDHLQDALMRDHFAVSSIHGAMSAIERRDVMHSFRSGETRILISTTLLSRGIDIQQISVVINYDLPKDKETYIHSCGRSGRYGRKGVAINFITRRDYNQLREIEKFYDTHIEVMPQNISDYI